MDESNGTSRDRDTRLETLFDTSPDSIILHDANGAIVDVNERALDALGYRRDELLSMFIDEIDVGFSLPELQRLWEQIEPGDRETTTGEHRRKDGSTFPVEVSIRNLELDDRDRYLAISRDITERTEYEHRLTALQGSTRELVQASSKAAVADIAVDIARDLLDFSLPVVWYPTEDGTALTMAARSPEMAALLEEPDVDEPIHHRGEWLWDAYESGETLVRDPIPRDQLGADVPLQSTIVLPLGEHGLLTCATRGEGDFSERDVEITDHLAQSVEVALDQIEFEEQLKHQRDNVRLLNDVMRHDIRNDLQVVTATAGLLEDEVGPPHQGRIRTLLDRTAHAIELTETARDIAAVMETPDRDLRELPLRGVLEQEVAEVRDRYAEAEVRVARTIPGVTVLADELLHSVFRNLLNNAIQHNPDPNPSVTVSAETQDGTAVVRVADDGPGVPEDQREEIFGKGEKRLDSAGSGIGLHLVRTLVDEYGGEIRVRDNEPTGSVFVVELRTPGDQDG